MDLTKQLNKAFRLVMLREPNVMEVFLGIYFPNLSGIMEAGRRRLGNKKAALL